MGPGRATLLQLLREFHYRYRDLTKQMDDTTKNVRHFLLINSITNWEGFKNKKITHYTHSDSEFDSQYDSTAAGFWGQVE